MIERRERGEPYDFDGFMQRHGDLVPGNPKTLDELLENMARRMAADEPADGVALAGAARRSCGRWPSR